MAFVQGGFSILASAAVARLLPASKALAFTPVGVQMVWVGLAGPTLRVLPPCYPVSPLPA
ncbi:MAG: hypothetical protein AAGH78_00095 [Cyanobacteria bacterium P01_H01_bin.58]